MSTKQISIILASTLVLSAAAKTHKSHSIVDSLKFTPSVQIDFDKVKGQSNIQNYWSGYLSITDQDFLDVNYGIDDADTTFFLDSASVSGNLAGFGLKASYTSGKTEFGDSEYPAANNYMWGWVSQSFLLDPQKWETYLLSTSRTFGAVVGDLSVGRSQGDSRSNEFDQYAISAKTKVANLDVAARLSQYKETTVIGGKLNYFTIDVNGQLGAASFLAGVHKASGSSGRWSGDESTWYGVRVNYPIQSFVVTAQLEKFKESGTAPASAPRTFDDKDATTKSIAVTTSLAENVTAGLGYLDQERPGSDNRKMTQFNLRYAG